MFDFMFVVSFGFFLCALLTEMCPKCRQNATMCAGSNRILAPDGAPYLCLWLCLPIYGFIISLPVSLVTNRLSYHTSTIKTYEHIRKPFVLV